MPNEEIDLLTGKFVDALSPIRIYLFGSYAEGRQTEESDFDFYIVVNDAVTDIIETTAKAYKSIRRVRTKPVDIIVGTESRFDKRKELPSIENEVFRKGVLLYGE